MTWLIFFYFFISENKDIDVIELDELLTKNEKHRNAYRLANKRETRKQQLKFF